MLWCLDRIFGAAVGVTRGGDLKLFARQKMHGEAAGFLAGVVWDGDDFAVTALLRLYFFLPNQKIIPIAKTGKTL